MSVNYRALVIYGFPADGVNIEVAGKLGQKAPCRRDWLEARDEWRKAEAQGIDLIFLGQPNGGNAIPFIGRRIAVADDFSRSYEPYTQMSSDRVDVAVTNALIAVFDLLYPESEGAPEIDKYVAGSGG